MAVYLSGPTSSAHERLARRLLRRSRVKLVLEQPQGAETLEIGEQGLQIGAPEDPVPIPGRRLTHACVHLKDGSAVLVPKVPLWIGQTAATEGVERLLLPGDVVDFGEGFRLRVPKTSEAAEDETRQVLQGMLMNGALSHHLSGQTLVCLTGLDQGRRFVLREGRWTAGRGTDADIRIRDCAVSRKHLQITHKAGALEVQDVGTSNGTLLNGKMLEGTALLLPGDVLEMGKTVLRFIDGTGLDDGGAQVEVEDTSPVLRPAPHSDPRRTVFSLWGLASCGLALVTVGLWFALSAALGLP